MESLNKTFTGTLVCNYSNRSSFWNSWVSSWKTRQTTTYDVYERWSFYKMLGGKNMIMIKKEDGKEIEWIEDIDNIDIQKEVGENGEKKIKIQVKAKEE